MIKIKRITDLFGEQDGLEYIIGKANADLINDLTANDGMSFALGDRAALSREDLKSYRSGSLEPESDRDVAKANPAFTDAISPAEEVALIQAIKAMTDHQIDYIQ